MADQYVAAASVSSATATVVLGGALAFARGAAVSSVIATATLTGAATFARANTVSSATATAVLSGAAKFARAGTVSSVIATANLTGASDTHGVSVCNAMQEIVMMWGLACYKTAPAYAILRAINDLNAAMQTVWNRAQERNFWSGVTITVVVEANTDALDLDDSIQNVTGPCRLTSTKRPLTPIGTLGEMETFSDLYLDGDTSLEPLAYHVERLAQAGNDPARCIFRVTPTPTVQTSFMLDVVMEAPRYTTDDLLTCPIIPMPHRYVESLLLPIARFRAASFSLMAVPQDQMERITREYAQAMEALGLADPLPGKAGDNETRRE
jgi:hypothetical protein